MTLKRAEINTFFLVLKFNLKGHYDEVKNNPVAFSILDMLSMLPNTYSKYSDRKNPHLMSSSDNRISGSAFYVVYK